MAVTQEMIDALFETPSQGAPAKGGKEREHSRIPFRGRAAAVVFPPPSSPKAEPVESEVVTTDISRGGLSLLHRRELEPGQQVLLSLSRGTCTVEVCWCCRVWSGLYIAGCKFLDSTITRPAD
jgi:PilZ domain